MYYVILSWTKNSSLNFGMLGLVLAVRVRVNVMVRVSGPAAGHVSNTQQIHDERMKQKNRN